MENEYDANIHAEDLDALDGRTPLYPASEGR
jgi:hypothetical protein